MHHTGPLPIQESMEKPILQKFQPFLDSPNRRQTFFVLKMAQVTIASNHLFSLHPSLSIDCYKTVEPSLQLDGWRVLNEDCELIVNANCVGASSPSAAHNSRQEFYGAPKNEKAVTPTILM